MHLETNVFECIVLTALSISPCFQYRVTRKQHMDHPAPRKESWLSTGCLPEFWARFYALRLAHLCTFAPQTSAKRGVTLMTAYVSGLCYWLLTPAVSTHLTCIRNFRRFTFRRLASRPWSSRSSKSRTSRQSDSMLTHRIKGLLLAQESLNSFLNVRAGDYLKIV